jgi:hypothetical protein
MQYAIFTQHQWSHDDKTYWKFQGMVKTEPERDHEIRLITEEIGWTRKSRIKTIAHRVIEFE